MEKAHPFVVVEGQNKSGKGTIIKFLHERLGEEGIDSRIIREPGGTEVGELIRGVLLAKEVKRPAMTNTLLFNAARAATVLEINRELENRGVIADRSYLSTLAFQIYGDGADEELTRSICAAAISEGYDPDSFILLDIPFKAYAQRNGMMKDQEEDYFEKGEEYFERVREGYLIEARAIGATVIDAYRTTEEVKNDVWDVVKEVL